MPIAAGELNRRVELHEEVASRGDGGAAEFTLTLRATVWAKVEPGGGSQAERSGGELARQSCRFTVRKRAGLGPRWQVRYQGVFYLIEDVSEPVEGLNEYLVITAYADERSVPT